MVYGLGWCVFGCWVWEVSLVVGDEVYSVVLDVLFEVFCGEEFVCEV